MDDHKVHAQRPESKTRCWAGGNTELGLRTSHGRRRDDDHVVVGQHLLVDFAGSLQSFSSLLVLQAR